MQRRASGSRESRPNTVARPAVGCAEESSIFTNVVLPAPLGPSSPNVVPRVTRSDIPSTARISLLVHQLRKTLVNPSVAMAKSDGIILINAEDPRPVHFIMDECG